jgi:DNA-binding HxlR family transcriptional regulator
VVTSPSAQDAFDGIRRFSQFQRSLGIAKNILAARLRDLVDAGVLRRRPGPASLVTRHYLTSRQRRCSFCFMAYTRYAHNSCRYK